MSHTCMNQELSSEILNELKSLRQENNLLKDYVMKFTNQVKLYLKSLNPQNRNSADGLISVKDLCSKLSITNATVHNWIKGGILTKHKIGGRTYFLEEEINKVVSNNKLII